MMRVHLKSVSAVVHRVQHAAVDRLEAIGHCRQGPANDDAHRVVEVRPLHLGLNLDGLDPAVWAVVDYLICCGVVSHDSSCPFVARNPRVCVS